MKLSWFAAVVAVLSLALCFGARAQVAATPYVFVTVDAVENENGQRLRIKGIQQGQSTATEVYVDLYVSGDAAASAARVQSCERLALLAMNKPGQYLYQVGATSSYGYRGCRLTRLNP